MHSFRDVVHCNMHSLHSLLMVHCNMHSTIHTHSTLQCALHHILIVHCDIQYTPTYSIVILDCNMCSNIIYSWCTAICTRDTLKMHYNIQNTPLQRYCIIAILQNTHKAEQTHCRQCISPHSIKRTRERLSVKSANHGSSGSSRSWSRTHM